MSRPVYRLNVTREGRWWIVDAVEIDYRTQARTLTEAEEMGRDLIAAMLDVDEASFDIDVHIDQPAEVRQRLDEASSLEAQARDAAAQAAKDRREAARILRREHGLSAIEVARLMGVSRARVYQLLDDREASA